MHWLLMFIFNLHVIKMNQSCLYQLQMVLTGALRFWISMSSLGVFFAPDQLNWLVTSDILPCSQDPLSGPQEIL